MACRTRLKVRTHHADSDRDVEEVGHDHEAVVAHTLNRGPYCTDRGADSQNVQTRAGPHAQAARNGHAERCQHGTQADHARVGHELNPVALRMREDDGCHDRSDVWEDGLKSCEPGTPGRRMAP